MPDTLKWYPSKQRYMPTNEPHILPPRRRTKYLRGRIVGYLYVKRRIGSDRRGNAVWLCVCHQFEDGQPCGGERLLTTAQIRRRRHIACHDHARELGAQLRRETYKRKVGLNAID